MKRVLLLSYFAALCLGQQASPTNQGVVSGRWDVVAAEQTIEGNILHLRGHAEMRNADLVLRADGIDYDADKAIVHLTGHVTIETKHKDTIRADEADYYLNSGRVSVKAREGRGRRAKN